MGMGEKGGEHAADALLSELQRYVNEVVGVSVGMDIMVRAFANVGGLGAALERAGRLKDSSQLRSFFAGFSNRQPFFDFVDIGSGKERADSKIRGEQPLLFNHFLLTLHEQMYLVVCPIGKLHSRMGLA